MNTKRFIAALLLSLLLLPALAAPVCAATPLYTLESLLISYMLKTDGSVEVTQRYVLDCSDKSRMFPVRVPQEDGTTISDFRLTDEEANVFVRLSAYDPNQQDNVYVYKTDESNHILDIYHDAAGSKFTFTLTYRITGAITSYQDIAVFDYTVFDEKTLPYEAQFMKIVVNFEQSADKISDIYLWGHCELPVQSTKIDRTQMELSTGSGMTNNLTLSLRAVAPIALFPTNTNSQPQLKMLDIVLAEEGYVPQDVLRIVPEAWSVLEPLTAMKLNIDSRVNSLAGGWVVVILIMLIPAAGLLVLLYIIKNNNRRDMLLRNNEPDKSPRYCKSLPDDLTPAEAARLLLYTKAANLDRPSYFAGTLLDLYRKGFIALHFSKNDIVLTMLRDGEYSEDKELEGFLPEYERLLLYFIKNIDAKSLRVTSDDLMDYIFRNCEKASSLAKAFRADVDRELYDKGMIEYTSGNMLYKYFTSKLSASQFMIGSIALIVIAAVLEASWLLGAGYAFMFSGLLLLLLLLFCAWSRNLYLAITKRGENSAADWNAFARYISESEHMLSDAELSTNPQLASFFMYGAAFSTNRRALRFLNTLLPWVTEADYGTELYGSHIGGMLEMLRRLEASFADAEIISERERGFFSASKKKMRLRAYERSREEDAALF